MKFLRIVMKPFKLKNWAASTEAEFTCEEVTGLGYHPERLAGAAEDRALLSELPRMAADCEAGSAGDVENIRLALRTGEPGDGKIFVFPLLDRRDF